MFELIGINRGIISHQKSNNSDIDDRSADESHIELRGERDVIGLRNPTEDKRAFRQMLTSADQNKMGNKMAVKSHVSHICRVSGNVSLPNGGFGPGGLSLWQCDETKEYQIQVERMEGPTIMVCGLLMFSVNV